MLKEINVQHIAEFCERYTPDDSVTSDHFHPATEAGVFEVFGEDLEYVKDIAKTAPARVWTEADVEGGTFLISGFHKNLNPICYTITKEPSVVELEMYWITLDEESK